MFHPRTDVVTSPVPRHRASAAGRRPCFRRAPNRAAVYAGVGAAAVPAAVVLLHAATVAPESFSMNGPRSSAPRKASHS